MDLLALRGRLLKDRARQTAGDARRTAYQPHPPHTKRSSTKRAIRFRPSTRRRSRFSPGTRSGLGTGGRDSHALDAAKDHDYYYHATRAEVALLANDLSALDATLCVIVDNGLGNEGARATTRRQLREICIAIGVDPAVLAPIQGPTLIHYTGHLYGEDFDDRAFVAELRRTLAELNVGYGYGSLAAGADIVLAEALLERDAAVHVVLPFEREEFRRVSVTACGISWGARFDHIMNHAASIHYATEDAYLGDDILFGYASRFAMGLAILRADALIPMRSRSLWSTRTMPIQASLPATSARGARRSAGRSSFICPAPHRSPMVGSPAAGIPPRVLRSMLFGDVHGFSKLHESQFPVFVTEFLGRFARVLKAHGERIEYRNTWGDGLYVVMSDAAAAARCALELQDTIGGFDPTAAGYPPAWDFGSASISDPCSPSRIRSWTGWASWVPT